MRWLLGCVCFIPLLAMAAAPPLEFAQTDPNYQQQSFVLPLANGGTLLIGGARLTPIYAERSGIFSSVGLLTGVISFYNPGGPFSLTVLDSTGSAVPNTLSLGSGDTFVSDAALDSAGNIWLTGETDSDDFPLVSALITKKLPYQQTGFIAKLDPTATTILFSTFHGGIAMGSTDIAALAIDPSGNAYVAGSTSQSDFPTTLPVFGSGVPGTTATSTLTYSFVSKIASDGSALVYSVLLGGSQEGSNLSGAIASPYTEAAALAVDSGGNVTVGGTTTATDFPTTAHAFQTTCTNCGQNTSNFVARLSPTATTLVWSTYLSIGNSNAAYQTLGALKLDDADNVVVSLGPAGQFSVLYDPDVAPASQPLQILKLSAEGTTLLANLSLPGLTGLNYISGITFDPNGNLWVTVSSLLSFANPFFLGAGPNSASSFALEINASFSAVSQSFQLPSGVATQPPVFDADGNLVLLSGRGAVLRLNPATAATAPAVFAIANAAILTADGGFSAGELVTFFGVGLGPAVGVTASPDANGVYPTQLGGVSVSISGVAAPLLYVGANQINLQIPFEFQQGPGSVVVNTPNGALSSFTVPATISAGIFVASDGYAAALNQDQTINSATNPAAPGSIVTIFATGLQVSQPPADGAIWQATDASPLLPFGVEVTDEPGLAPLNLLYAGPAPGLIDGVYQFNVQLATDLVLFPTGVLELIQLPQGLGSNYVPVHIASITANEATERRPAPCACRR